MRYLIALLLLVSCSESKKLQKAKQRVLLDNVTFNEVGAKWRELNKCANDTSYINNIDTLATVEFWSSSDTIYIDSVKTIVKIVERIKPIVKTKVQTIVDRQHENQLKDSIAAWRNEAGRLAILIEQHKRQTVAMENQRNKAIGIIVVALLLIVGYFIAKIKLARYDKRPTA